MTYRVHVDFEDQSDAQALADLIKELGYTPSFYSITPVRKTPIHQTRGGKVILTAMIPGRTYTPEDIAEALVDRDFAPTSASGLTGELVREGFLKKVARGLYRLATLGDLK